MKKNQLELLKDALWMSCLWGQSLIDSDVPNGKSDLRKAKRAYDLVKKKLEKLKP